MRITVKQIAALVFGLLLVLPATAAAQLGNPVGGSTRGTLGSGDLSIGWGTSSAESVRVRSVTLTNAQILAIHTTAVTIIPAPGAGLAIDVIGVLTSFDYTAAYTSGANLRLYYGSIGSGTAASSAITVSGFIVSVSADKNVRVAGTPDNTTIAANTAVVLSPVDAVAFGGGNASNAVRFQVIYRVVAVP